MKISMGQNEKIKVCKIIGIFLLATLSLCCCTGKAKRMLADKDSITNNGNELVMNDEKIKKWLSWDWDEPEFSLETMEMSIPYEWDYITKHGFKPVSDKEFKERINEIFTINLDSSENYKKNMVQFKHFYEFAYPEWTENEEPDYKIGSGMWSFGTCFVKKFNFITDENTLEASLELSDDGKRISYSFPKTLYQNQYIFHSSKSALTWLMANDERFLNSLVEMLGYMGDKQLLEWYIKNHICDFSYASRRQDFEDFTKMITTRRPDGTFRFNQEILDVMNEDPKTHIDEVSSYLMCFCVDEPNLDIDEKFPAFKEKAETVARLLYWGENQPYDVTGGVYEFAFMPAFTKFCQEMDKYDAEFKRCNYYGLQDFEKQWKEAKIYGPEMGVPMR